MQPVRPHRTRTKHQGFSLVELLVVLVVIGIVAAFLLPVFARVREKGRQAQCMSNLRQIWVAYQMYYADWGAYSTSAPFLAAYNKDQRIVFCPDNSFAYPTGSSYTYHDTVPPTFAPLAQVKELLPQTVLVHCDNHTGQKREDGLSPIRFPYHLVLRASGAVQLIPMKAIRQDVHTGHGLANLYPDEPGYDRPGAGGH